MEKILINNWVKNLLAPAMRENGCISEIRTPEDVINNLYYLSKEDNRGSRYIPLQYKRMVEKIVFGLFNTGFEYKDNEDVYFDKIGDTVVCCANVFFVSYLEDGSKKVLGHGFHCLSLDEVMPGIFLSEAERAAKWKATVIGAAKSRALYDAGIGLEFYGDIFAPLENIDEQDIVPDKEVKVNTKKARSESHVYSKSGMPIPKPKREPSEKDASGKKGKLSKELPLSKEAGLLDEPGISLEVARSLKADCGTFAGMTLGEIYETAPKNLIFLQRNSNVDEVKKAAAVIISSDEELKAKLA